ncbi:MAG: Asp-tRNA(Asn)/Glu-tRNA(Gln) amidotransferase subunit GatC [Gemmatimonadaceae bacterium]
MSVTEDELRHIAALARLHLDPARVSALVGELNGILAHVESLQRADTSNTSHLSPDTPGMRLREDTNPQRALATARESFAPIMRDGFFLVPRLATHEDAEEG